MTRRTIQEWRDWKKETARFFGFVFTGTAIISVIQFALIKVGVLNAESLKWGGENDVGMALGTALLFIITGISIFLLGRK